MCIRDRFNIGKSFTFNLLYKFSNKLPILSKILLIVDISLNNVGIKIIIAPITIISIINIIIIDAILAPTFNFSSIISLIGINTYDKIKDIIIILIILDVYKRQSLHLKGNFPYIHYLLKNLKLFI